MLDENVVGVLETTTSGAPSIDADLILRLPFGGFFNLTAYDPDDPEKAIYAASFERRGTLLKFSGGSIYWQNVTAAYQQIAHTAEQEGPPARESLTSPLLRGP